jgi:multidrug efflux system membrane fusion protein
MPEKTTRSWVSIVIWLIVGIIVIGGVGGFVVWRMKHPANAAAAGKGKGAGGPIPVVAVKARTGSLDIYLNGLGTVTALNTVSIHTRVDGQLDKVSYTEGQTVQQGQLLCEIDPRPFQDMLTQAQGQLIRDEALLKDAAVNLKRYQDLLKQGDSITQAQVDTQAALVSQYQGAVKTDNGVIQADQLNIEYCQIKAPFTGRIGLRLVDPGNIVHATDTNPLAVITQIQPITVIFTLAEDDISKVMDKLNPKAPLTVEAWDRDMTKKIATGTLLAVDNQVDPTTGTVKLRGQFDNKDNVLFPNEFVNARLRVETLHDVLLVPTAAIQRGPDSTYIFVAQPNNKINVQPVTVGPTEGNYAVILTGLKVGDLAVTDGVDKLEQGTQVSLRERAKKKGATTQPSTTRPVSESPYAEGTSSANTAHSTTQPAAAAHHGHAKPQTHAASSVGVKAGGTE